MGRYFFGVELHEYYDANTIVAETELAERLGYDAVWLGDSQMIWREMYVLLGAAAKATSRVWLGTGVTNPITRLPAVTASAITTLQELSGGRGILGVGTGDSSVRILGMKPATLAGLEQLVNQVRCNFFRGESSSGFQRTMGHIRAGLKERTLPAHNFQIILMRGAAIHDDRKKAFAAVRPKVARALLTYRWEMSEAVAKVKTELQAAYNYYEHMSADAGHAELIPDEVIPEFAIAENTAECREQVASSSSWVSTSFTSAPTASIAPLAARSSKRLLRRLWSPSLASPSTAHGWGFRRLGKDLLGNYCHCQYLT